ncbi:MAG TPA: hypothetical protein PKC74_07070, partial [Turneriella sp.]|nr:hypothetical protein [Turneriella sp.]
MPGFSDESLHCLALHSAGRTLSEKNRRLLEAAGSLLRLAPVLLANEFAQFLGQARETLHRLGTDTV